MEDLVYQSLHGQKEEEDGVSPVQIIVLDWVAQCVHRCQWGFFFTEGGPPELWWFFIFPLLQDFENYEFLGRFYF